MDHSVECACCKGTIVWDKTSKKEQAKENREAAKQEAFSILKSEFGLFKNDTTVKGYQPKVQGPHEELRIEFGKEETLDPVEEKKKTNKAIEKLKEKTKKLKLQQEKEKETEFIVEWLKIVRRKTWDLRLKIVIEN